MAQLHRAMCDGVHVRCRTPTQYQLLQSLLSGGAQLFTVGDFHQSVYGWRGALPEAELATVDTPEGILHPCRSRDGPAASPSSIVLALQRNHRCAGAWA